MIGLLKSLFENPQSDNRESVEDTLRLVAAALLIETARSDFTEDAAELDKLSALLASSLQLAEPQVKKLIAAAEMRVEESTSLYEYTSIINAHYNATQKVELIDAMWAVAYADGNVDKYEEHLIRQVAELTYVPHANYIHSKLAAQS